MIKVLFPSTIIPCINWYVFFITFIGVKVVLVYSVLQSGGDMKEAVMVAWDDETEALFAAVMSFWFGSRAMPRLKARNT